MNHATSLVFAAGAACAAATLLLGAELRRAITVDDAPAGRIPVVNDDGSVATVAAPASLTTEALLLAIDNDPFMPDRKRSSFRYRLPGDEPPPPPSAPPPPPPVPPFRLIGTGSSPKGGVAVIEIENTARLVEVGESLLGFTLTAVNEDHATMADSEQNVRLPLLASTAATAAAPQRPNQRAPAAPPAARMQFEDAAIQFMQPRQGANPEQLRELIERVRQLGGGNMTPQMLETLQRLQAEGRQVEVQTQGGRTMIRTRPDTTDTSSSRVPNIF